MKEHRSATGKFAKGLMYGLAAALIWGGFPVMTRLGVHQPGLGQDDITFIRYAVSGLILMPFLRPSLLRQFSWQAIGIVVAGIGFPYMLVVSSGLKGAPVEVFALITPGGMICFSLLMSRLILKTAFTRESIIGITLIIAGAFSVYLTQHMESRTDTCHSCMGYFVLGAFLWACYTVATRKYAFTAFQLTVIVSVISMLIYGPFYLHEHGMKILSLDTSTLLWQAFYQGVLVSILALFFYSKSVQLLGSVAGATFAALVPVFSTLMADLLLGEHVPMTSWAALLVITTGMLIVVFGPVLRQYLRSPP
ncbi:MAG: DMT family transporter [Lautropia sp.]|nr:DMT family transporter [Lautropia sp.]